MIDHLKDVLVLHPDAAAALEIDIGELVRNSADYFVSAGVRHNGWEYRWSSNADWGGPDPAAFWVTLWFDGPADERQRDLMYDYMDDHHDYGLPAMKGKWDAMEHSHDMYWFAWQKKFTSAGRALHLWRTALERPQILGNIVRLHGEPRTVDEVFAKYGLDIAVQPATP